MRPSAHRRVPDCAATLRDYLARGVTGRLERPHRASRGPGGLHVFIMAGEILAAHGPDDGIWIVRRLVNGGALTERLGRAFTRALERGQPFEELLVSKVPGRVLSAMLEGRFRQNLLDFVTGASPVRFAPMDTIFVANLQHGHDSQALLRAIVDRRRRISPLVARRSPLTLRPGPSMPATQVEARLLDFCDPASSLERLLTFSPYEPGDTLDAVTSMLTAGALVSDEGVRLRPDPLTTRRGMPGPGSRPDPRFAVEDLFDAGPPPPPPGIPAAQLPPEWSQALAESSVSSALDEFGLMPETLAQRWAGGDVVVELETAEVFEELEVLHSLEPGELEDLRSFHSLLPDDLEIMEEQPEPAPAEVQSATASAQAPELPPRPTADIDAPSAAVVSELSAADIFAPSADVSARLDLPEAFASDEDFAQDEWSDDDAMADDTAPQAAELQLHFGPTDAERAATAQAAATPAADDAPIAGRPALPLATAAGPADLPAPRLVDDRTAAAPVDAAPAAPAAHAPAGAHAPAEAHPQGHDPAAEEALPGHDVFEAGDAGTFESWDGEDHQVLHIGDDAAASSEGAAEGVASDADHGQLHVMSFGEGPTALPTPQRHDPTEAPTGRTFAVAPPIASEDIDESDQYASLFSGVAEEGGTELVFEEVDSDDVDEDNGAALVEAARRYLQDAQDARAERGRSAAQDAATTISDLIKGENPFGDDPEAEADLNDDEIVAKPPGFVFHDVEVDESQLAAFADNDYTRAEGGRGQFTLERRLLDVVDLSEDTLRALARGTETDSGPVAGASDEPMFLEMGEASEEEELEAGAVALSFAAPVVSNSEAMQRVDVALDVLGRFATQLDRSTGPGTGQTAVQLLLESAPNQFGSLLHSLQADRKGLFPPMELIARLNQRPQHERRLLLDRCLSDLIERALGCALEELPEEALDQFLEQIAGYQQRLRG